MAAAEEGGEEPVLDFGVEHDGPSSAGELVGVGATDLVDQVVESEASQVVGHLVGAVGLTEESGDKPAKAVIDETGDGVDDTAERTGQGDGAWVPEAPRPRFVGPLGCRAGGDDRALVIELALGPLVIVNPNLRWIRKDRSSAIRPVRPSAIAPRSARDESLRPDDCACLH